MEVFDEKAPIYIQIINIIKNDIVSGKLKPGDKIPSVREMSIQFKVNPNTLQRAYQELERDDITYTQRGVGTFVKEDVNMVQEIKKEMAEEIIKDFIKGMVNLGFTSKEIINIVEKKFEEEI